METMIIHGVLKQGKHGKIPLCSETGKPWYNIHLTYTNILKNMVYHSLLCNIMVYHVILTKYHGILCHSIGYPYENINNNKMTSLAPICSENPSSVAQQNQSIIRHSRDIVYHGIYHGFL